MAKDTGLLSRKTGFSYNNRERRLEITPVDLIQDVNELHRFLDDLGVDPEYFSSQSGISLSNVQYPLEPRELMLVNCIVAILYTVKPWFDSSFQCWSWFVGEPLIGFSNMTAAQILREQGLGGADAVFDFIASKNLVAFE